MLRVLQSGVYTRALRIALPRDKSVDIGLHALLRNDAFRAGGPIWN